MSKVKTRKEIKEEMDATIAEISALRKSHAEAVAGFESTIEQMKEEQRVAQELITAKDVEIESAKQAIIDADAKLEAVQTEYKEQTEKLSAEIEEQKAELAEVQSGFEKAKAALQNPAFVDAATVPSPIDQKLEDAEADAQEQEPEDKPEPSTVSEVYQSMDAGPERVAFWNKNKRQILKELESKEY